MRHRLALAAVALTACASTQERGRKLSPDIFEDIPAPRAATYRHGNAASFSYRARTFRCGKFRYDHPGRDRDVVRFFKETMTRPPYSWSLTREDSETAGSTTLEFTKNDDLCTVDVDTIPRLPSNPHHVSILVRVNYRR